MGRCRVRSCDLPWVEVISLVDKEPGPEPTKEWVAGPVSGAHARVEVCMPHSSQVRAEQDWKVIVHEGYPSGTWLVPA